MRKCKRNSTYLTPRTPQGLMQNYWKVMYLAIREFVFQNTFVASCNFVCIPHFISVGQISSVYFFRTNEKNFSDGKIVVRDDVSLRSGLLVDYFGSSRQKIQVIFTKKNMFAFLKCVVRIPIYSAVKISFMCYADLTNFKKWSEYFSNMYYLFLFAS